MPPTEKKQEPAKDKRIDAHRSPLIKQGLSMFSLKTLFKFKTLTSGDNILITELCKQYLLIFLPNIEHS